MLWRPPRRSWCMHRILCTACNRNSTRSFERGHDENILEEAYRGRYARQRLLNFWPESSCGYHAIKRFVCIIQVEALTRCQNRFLSPSHLHDDRAFQHINKRMCIVAMYGIGTARRVLYCKHETFLARDVVEVFRQDLRHLRLVGHERARCEKCQHQN